MQSSDDGRAYPQADRETPPVYGAPVVVDTRLLDAIASGWRAAAEPPTAAVHEPGAMSLNDYVRIFRAHWIAILFAAGLGVLVAYGWSSLQERVYTADASGYVVPFRSEGESQGSAYVSSNLASSKVKSFVEVGSWRTVADHAIEELGLDLTPDRLIGRVDISNPADTVVIKVAASGPTPEEAQALAGAWLRGMVAEIDKLETGGGEGEPTVSLVVSDSARLPSQPTFPNTRLALAIGGMFGALLGVAYSLVRHVLDRRIRSVEGVERETGLSVVGAIPHEGSFTSAQRLIPAASSGSPLLFGVSEAFRDLRSNIQFMDVDRPPRVLVITSPLPGDGKSTISGNLALTLAENGRRVILIDGDLRRPMVSSIFDIVDGVGLTDVLAGHATVQDVAQGVPQSRNLLVIGAGRIPPNPSEVLGSDRVRDLLRQLSEDATVIIDAPPLIPVTDAAVLAMQADGAIIVTTVGKTTFDMLNKALKRLERVGGRALGVVLNRVPRKGSGAAYYGYQYTGDYYRAPETAMESDESGEAILSGTSRPSDRAVQSGPLSMVSTRRSFRSSPR